MPRFLLEDEDFPGEIERAVASAFLQTDTAFAEACSVNSSLASGTTALAALVVGRSGLVYFFFLESLFFFLISSSFFLKTHSGDFSWQWHQVYQYIMFSRACLYQKWVLLPFELTALEDLPGGS